MNSKVHAAGEIRERLNAIAARRIIILDGAMGSLIQSYHLTEEDFRGERFAGHPAKLLGCNDLLCLTRPELISRIHRDYLEAGADITKTCSFNATAISLEHVGLGDLAYEISRAAAALAREAADWFSTAGRPRFVAGSMGPTAKSGSLSPDINQPEKRAVTWNELAAAYYDNARGLLDGGADILLVETIIDTLNAKAAIFAINKLREERGLDLPIMLSASVAGQTGGRILAGQTLAALCVSVAHAEPWALGLNCSFGAEALKSSVTELGARSAELGGSWLISAHPNAGLPNGLGAYDESPESMALKMEPYFAEALVNIAGGCCGTTPAHIAALAETAGRYPPRPAVLPTAPTATPPATPAPATRLSALVDLSMGREAGLRVIGEGTNAAKNREFRAFIHEENYDDALALAAETIEAGATILDVCMDDALLDGERAMVNFLNFVPQDPDVARTPLMIDSGAWDLIEAGLSCVQGKCLVYSISLAEGPDEFLRRAALVRSYGAAPVVALRDERGPAPDYERNIELARRSWQLLREAGFPARELVFDPIVPAGIVEHDPRVPDFIRSCAWIRDNCPGAQILGRFSDLGPGGGEQLQQAIPAVFLTHALNAGLSLAIGNPATLLLHSDIDAELRKQVEKLLFNGYS